MREVLKKNPIDTKKKRSVNVIVTRFIGLDILKYILYKNFKYIVYINKHIQTHIYKHTHIYEYVYVYNVYIRMSSNPFGKIRHSLRKLRDSFTNEINKVIKVIMTLSTYKMQ